MLMKHFLEVPSRRTHLAFDVLPRPRPRAEKPPHNRIVLGVDMTNKILEGNREATEAVVLNWGDEARKFKRAIDIVGCTGKVLFTIFPPT